MTSSTVKPPLPPGRFEIRLLKPHEQAYRSALALVLSGSPVWSTEISRQAANLESLARRKDLRADLLVAAYSSVRLVSAALAVESPGRTAMVYTPPGDLAPDERRATCAVLLDMQRRLWKREVTLLQSLLPVEDRCRPQVYASAGFEFLAELIYMDRPVHLEAHKISSALNLQMQTYRPRRRALFLRALEESYEESQDCPGLSGRRETEDVLKGHLATGVFDPDGWFVALVGEKPAGVLLTARVPCRAALEVVYMGVSRQMRGKGVGDRLMARALSFARAQLVDDVTLAVDSINEAARGLYRRWQFEETSRRGAWIATAPPGSAREGAER